MEELGVIMVNRIRFGSDVNGDCFLICLEKSELFILALTKSRVYKTLNIRVVYLKTRVRINLTVVIVCSIINGSFTKTEPKCR